MSTEERLAQENEGLRIALETRDVIGQAKGVIRLLVQCDGEAAFRLLASLSQDTNSPVRDIAVLIAEWAASGAQLPENLATSWHQHTAGPTPA